MGNSSFISSLSPDDSVSGKFALRSCELREYSRGQYIQMDIADRSGHITATYWLEDAREVYNSIKDSEIVQLSGRISTYKGKLTVTVDYISPVKEGEYDPEEIIPSTKFNREKLWQRVIEISSSVEDTHLKTLLLNIFSEKNKQQILTAPAGKRWHHAFIGGLVEHSIAVASICNYIAELYSLDRDLLVTGALLHDIGKLEELKVTSFIDYSTKGRLLGHIVLGINLVSREIEKIGGFPEETKFKLLHLLASHQGKQEQGSAVPPMTKEAFVLYLVDEIDSKLNALSHIEEKNKGKDWSEYIKLLNRFIYLK
ncbi:HD domain-containing protein [bacterium]|nr:HD domain-containing protein [bacterium]